MLSSRVLYDAGSVLFYANIVATKQMRPLSACNMASVSKEPNFKFYLILISLSSHTLLVANVLHSAGREISCFNLDLFLFDFSNLY